MYKWKLYTRNKASSLIFFKENAAIAFDDINHQAKEYLTKIHIFIHAIICYFLFKKEKIYLMIIIKLTRNNIFKNN